MHRAQAQAQAALARFDESVLTALKETEQALSIYTAELQHRQALIDYQSKARRSFELAREQYAAGAVSNLDLLTSEVTLVNVDAQVASSDGAIVQDQITVFKALGGGWGGMAP